MGQEPALLVVDDDTDCLTLLGLAIKRLPWRVRFATVQDGEEAVAYLNGQGQYSDRETFPFPKLILLDLKMPKMDGFAFLAWLRKQPEIGLLPVVVLTISAFDGDVWRAYQSGANSFMTKDVGVPEMARQLGPVLEHWLHFASVPESCAVPQNIIVLPDSSPGKSRVL